MIVVMTPHASETDIQAVIETLSVHGFDVHRSSGLERTVLGAIGVKPGFDHRGVAALDGVDVVHRITRSLLADGRPSLPVGSTRIGGGSTTVWASFPEDGTAADAALDPRHRLSGGIVSPAMPGFRQACEGLRRSRRSIVVEAGPGDDSVHEADAFVLSAAALSDSAVLDRFVATGRPLWLRRPEGTVGDWIGFAAQVRRCAFVLEASGVLGAVDMAALAELSSSGLGPVVVDAAAAETDDAWASSALAGIAAGAAAVIAAPPSPDEAHRRRLAALTAVASAIGRPVPIP